MLYYEFEYIKDIRKRYKDIEVLKFKYY